MDKQLDIFDVFNQPDHIIFSEVFPNTESDELEYKSAKGGFPIDFWKTYSAFANTAGGIIVLGVKEKRGQFQFDGLEEHQIEKYKKDFWNGANNPSTVSSNLLRNEDVKAYIIEGKKVLVFNIPPAERKLKPVYLTTNPFKNTYKRNYEGDYTCKDEEVRRMLSDADFTFSPDSRILEGYSIKDIDIPSLQQYRQLLASVKPSHTWLTLDDVAFLEQLGGYRKDRKTKKEGFTVAGMIMFGKYLSITDEECCPKFFPDYRELLSEIEGERWSDRIYPDGTFECNLFQFYKLVYPKLISRLPKPFQLIKGQRQDETKAHTALREAFVNTLIHTDYSALGSIVIECRHESFTFTNPGTLLVTLHQFYKGGISQCRNTNLQKMFLMIGSAEKAGSGVSKILEGWISSHWRKPYISIETEPDRIILEMPMFSVIPESTLSSLKELFGIQIETLGKDELTALAVCHIEGDVTNSKLQYTIDKHKSDITKLLQDLCKQGYLLSENKSRWTTYHLNTAYFIENILNETPNMDTSNMDTSNMDTSNMDTSNMDTLKFKELTPLQNKIIETCLAEYVSIEYISKQVNRSEKYLKNDIVPEMVKIGYLVRLYSKINHPEQKYISKSTN